MLRTVLLNDGFSAVLDSPERRRICLIGHGRHGKDTAAEILRNLYGYTFSSSSMAAAKIFLFDDLKDTYGYRSFVDCYEDRGNRRDEWCERITAYNTPDKARLARQIMAKNDIYVGMRCSEELAKSREIGLFDLVIGIFNPRLPLEPPTSMKIDLWKESDVVVPNSGTIYDLSRRFVQLKHLLV